MHAGELDAGHVTGRALFCAHRTGIGVATRGLRVSGFGQVTGEAFRIVVRGVFLEFLVRIVTSNTPEPRIVRVVSATTEHAIRLEANVVDASLPRLQHRLLKTGVTRAAKRLREIMRTQVSRIEDLEGIGLLRVRDVRSFHCHKVFLSWSMARLAADTRVQLV